MNGQALKSKINFLFLVLIAGILSTLLHELGHCIFYWIQGIPAAMSLVKEYPLVDIIPANQYAIGSAGGPLVNIVLIIVSYIMIRKYEKHSRAWNYLSALILANSFYVIVRSLIALQHGEGEELEYAANLIGLNYLHVIGLFFLITIVILALWTNRFRIKASVKNGLSFVVFLIAYFLVLGLMQVVDQSLFWNKFSTIQIDDGRVYHQKR
ncbi:MAG TPA: hypothetical protein VM123_04805 [archaeon]|nr:hypothetical protein [archaeon]